MSVHEPTYPKATRELAELRNRLAPGPAAAFRAFSRSVVAEGAIPTDTTQLIAVAVAHVTECPYCIRGHTGAGAASRRNGGGNHGSNLGRTEMRGGRVRALGFSAGYDRAHPGRTREKDRMNIRIEIVGDSRASTGGR